MASCWDGRSSIWNMFEERHALTLGCGVTSFYGRIQPLTAKTEHRIEARE
ncbi:MAG: hypothetical protein FWD05_07420 [Oscillospiraceae bacterium]|nr:hypothetical protein [Oscillospiraceae bacterium]